MYTEDEAAAAATAATAAAAAAAAAVGRVERASITELPIKRLIENPDMMRERACVHQFIFVFKKSIIELAHGVGGAQAVAAVAVR